VAWLTRDLAALAQPGIGARVAANTERLQRLLAGADPGGVGQVRAAAAVGALARPFAVLPDLNLGALHDTVVGAVLGAQEGSGLAGGAWIGAWDGAGCPPHA
jgi:hypothetical protein